MQKLVKISTSPVSPNIEVVGDIVIKIHLQYSESDVTILVNPNIQEYAENQDQPGIKIRHATATSDTDESRQLQLNLKDKNVQTTNINGKEYKITLMNIGKEAFEGQEFLYYEFFVESE